MHNNSNSCIEKYVASLGVPVFLQMALQSCICLPREMAFPSNISRILLGPLFEYSTSDGVTPSRSAPFANNDASLGFPLSRSFPRAGIPVF
jgi:hypothetical protein